MLSELVVENFALIEHLQREFHPGLNIITGETGAGKSLLTDAVGLLFGGKGDRDMIRRGTDKALIEGVFTGPFSPAVNAYCEENGIDTDTIVIRREMNGEGKNVVRVNGHRVTLSLLTALSSKLMNVHSQTEHFSLFKEEEQLTLLDRFGGEPLAAVKSDVAAAFHRWQEAQKAHRDLRQKTAAKDERIDYLRFQQKEIEKLGLSEGEDEELRTEARLLATGVERYADAQRVYTALSGDDSGGVLAALYSAGETLADLAAKDESLSALSAALKDAYYTLDDIKGEMASYRDNIDTDPHRLEEVESRLSDIRGAEKKYGRDVAGILAYLAEIEAEIAACDDADHLLAQAAAAAEAAEKDYIEQARKLTATRKAVGKALSAAIEEQLKDMKLPDARFAVALTEAAPSAEGSDGVTFMATMNKGEDLRPLAKVASGGEISRVLLGTKIILGRVDAVQTMIFDEIDSGLGGETAAKVGEKLRLLAEDTQVFAVTHSPLVAVAADHHYYIEKVEGDDRVTVALTELDEDGIRREIARMLSGDAASDVSLRQADDLLKGRHR